MLTLVAVKRPRGFLLDVHAACYSRHTRPPAIYIYMHPRGLLLDAHAACKQHAHAASRQARMAWNQMSTLSCHMPTRLTSRCPRGLLEHAHAKCTGGLQPDVHAAWLVRAHAAGWLPNVHAAWGCLPTWHTAICQRGLRLDAHVACRQHAPAVGSQVCARRASRSLLPQVRAACSQMPTLSCHVSARLASRYPRGLLEHAHAK